MKYPKITLFVMTYKGYKVLEFLDTHYKGLIETVVTAEDENVENDYYKEITAYCKKKAIPFANRKQISNIKTKYAFAVSWRWLIKYSSGKVIVFHDSLLPKYRGFNPLVSMLINNEKEVGVTALFASEKYDRGDIIGQSSSKLKYPIKVEKAIEQVTKNYLEIVDKIAKKIQNGSEIPSQKQNENSATYSLWRDEQDYFIDWTKDSDYLERFINALGYPYQGAKTHINEAVYTVLSAESLVDVKIENRTPGKVIYIEDGYPVVVCSKGLLKITEMYDISKKSTIPFKKLRSRFN